MKLGLVGLPMSGKTTIFNALTGSDRPLQAAVPGKLDVEMSIVDVPDERLERLTDLFNPEKMVPARITYVDIGGVNKGISEGGLSGPFRNELSQLDAFLQVVRAFVDENVPHPEDSINPQRDLDMIEAEFLLSDLIAVEKRIERLKEEMSKGKNRAANTHELDLFEQLQAALEEETPLRELDLTPDQINGLRGYGFLSIKPKLVLVNTGEDSKAVEDYVTLSGKNVLALALSGKIEMEIAQLDGDDVAMFMEEYQINELMRDLVISQSYRLLRSQIFFTVGDDECRAWPHPIGATAPEAAGKIHSDLERGFIAAEVIQWDLLLELGGLADAKKAGKLRVEGKTYVMQDGDVMSVRFNV